MSYRRENMARRWTHADMEEHLLRIAAGWSVAASCDEAGFSTSSYNSMRRRHPELAAQHALAMEMGRAWREPWRAVLTELEE